MTDRNPHYLLSVQELQRQLDDENLRLYDVAVFLRPKENGMAIDSGADDYARGHIPGAAFIDQLGQLSVADAPFNFTLPPVGQLAAAFGNAGISTHRKVVFYSSGHLMWATRAWWLLRYCGHDAVAVLNGGLSAWQAAGFDLEQGENRYAPEELVAREREGMFVDIDAIAAASESGSHRTVNALTAEIHAGIRPVGPGRAGHIPGSCNLPYGDLLRQTGDGERQVECFRPADELEQALRDAGLLGSEPVITYCGGGIAATLDAFACTLLGKTDVAVYDGSLSEWASDPQRPLVTDQE